MPAPRATAPRARTACVSERVPPPRGPIWRGFDIRAASRDPEPATTSTLLSIHPRGGVAPPSTLPVSSAARLKRRSTSLICARSAAAELAAARPPRTLLSGGASPQPATTQTITPTVAIRLRVNTARRPCFGWMGGQAAKPPCLPCRDRRAHSPAESSGLHRRPATAGRRNVRLSPPRRPRRPDARTRLVRYPANRRAIALSRPARSRGASSCSMRSSHVAGERAISAFRRARRLRRIFQAANAVIAPVATPAVARSATAVAAIVVGGTTERPTASSTYLNRCSRSTSRSCSRSCATVSR